jgi:hypothetical protein
MLTHQYWEDSKPFYDTQTVESYVITDLLVREGKESVADPGIFISYYRYQNYSKCVCPTLSSYFVSYFLSLSSFYPHKRRFTSGIDLLNLRR